MSRRALLDHDAGFRDALLRHGLVGDGPAEGDAQLRAPAHALERPLREADQPHAVVDAPRPEAPLCDLEAASLAEQHVLRRHAHVVEQHLRVAVRRVVEAEDRQHALHRDAGPRQRHQDHRLLPVPVGVLRVGLAHHDQDAAARVERARGPPLAAVDDAGVAVADDPGLDIGRIGRGDLDLGHGEGGANLAGEQRLQPLRPLCLGAVADQHLHVAGVGGRAVEDLRREVGAPHLLAGGRIVEVGEPGAMLALGQEQVPQPLRPGLRLQLFEQRDRLPAVAAVYLREHLLFVGVDMRRHEGRHPVAHVPGLVADVEVHGLFFQESIALLRR